MISKMKRCLALAVAMTVTFAGTNALGSRNPASAETYDNGGNYWGLENTGSAETGNRILVDLNRNDGRKASYSRKANNWCFPRGSASGSVKFQGITFTLSNGGGAAGNPLSENDKTLQKLDLSHPYLTMDGVTVDNSNGGGIIKLEIAGLSAGTHSLKTWHSCVGKGNSAGSMKITINGKTTQTGVACPTRVASEDDAGISYSTFEVTKGQTVTVLIAPEGKGNAWLNAFELDGGDPVQGISKMSPADQEFHHDAAKGLTWTAGKNMKSQDVYIGTDYNSVFSATHQSPEFKGSQTDTSFSLDDSYSSIPTYYWRVDTIDKNGNTIKGAVNSFQLNRLAFPTAEGYGRFARGGRGGQVIHVTNLNDSGEGSLRWALCDPQWLTEDWQGVPRVIVFDVGGVIALKDRLVIPDNGGNVYIAGQTAPGDGITLINYDFGGMGTSDLVIRDVRVRVGDMNGKSSGGMGLGSCNHSIVDHCSISWATDEGFSSRSAANISFQWNIIGESLHDSVHYDGDRTGTETHAFAASISGNKGSFHHNLLIDCTGRNWSLAGGTEQDETYGGQLDIRNNVVYNWRDRTTDGGARRLNFVNNYYKAGAESNTSLHVVSTDGNELGWADCQKMYVSGNVMLDQKGNYLLRASDNAWDKGKAVSANRNCTTADVRSDQPFFESYVNTQSAEDAYKSVIAGAGAGGASETGWDYIDARYIQEVTKGTYTYTGSKQGLKGIIDRQNDAGGYPNQNNFKYSTDGVCNAKNDTDRDGMPDAWEIEHGLNPKDPTDGAKVSLSGDDYTNLEMFLNELAGDPVEYNGTPVKRDPIDGKLIRSLEVLDNENYMDWSIRYDLKAGDPVFGDREVTFVTLPKYLNGAEYICTAADSKTCTTDAASFTAGEDLTVYVGLDTRVTSEPAWLQGWTRTEDTAVNSNQVAFRIYKKDVSKGDTVVLGANGQSSGCVFYTAFVTLQGVSPLLGDVDADGDVDAADAKLLRDYLVRRTASLPDAQAADLNGDGILNAADLAILKSMLLD